MRRIRFDELAGSDLVVDSVCEAGPQKNVAADPISRLLPVGNQGGIRYKGSVPSPRVVVLYTTGGVAEWPDELDEVTGILTYYGDNQHAGNLLHDTPRNGNRILKDSFARFRVGPADRVALPIFLLFESVGGGRDVRFRGLVVPGSASLNPDEELVALWRSEGGSRFQNYRAKFTVLAAPKVSRLWIDDVLAGSPQSDNAPAEWVEWVNSLHYQALEAPTLTPIRSKDQQLPAEKDQIGWALLNALRQSFADEPVKFEAIAVAIAKMSIDLPLTMDLTRPTADGGRDAVGKMKVGSSSDPVWITVALEAKCYKPTNRVGVKEVSRLVSRLRHRDLGILVTTSYLARQAYKEIRDDGHPVVVISGADIVQQLRRRGVNSPSELKQWLASNQPRN